MKISKELLDELLKGVERPEDLLGDAGLMKELKIKLVERMLGAERARLRRGQRSFAFPAAIDPPRRSSFTWWIDRRR
ncbi:hypothetical protein [Aestuariicoccus sp. MJ-SS9]|uniref:hypothetical protein n=1 Tax=Aestuariicoccus sp. MJ-SS9 TaxID=3079855 RepID=UPI00290CE606|nr:hypothetical protein [Aestuariicoccus sp. MJ-SS9]MDU8914147.1 hypothetical protein [Aestuariicoccus sp. MJ-SS9]